MTDSHDRMMKDHPRAGETHDFPDLFTHVGFITMYFAIGAKGLCFHKGAFVASLSGIGRIGTVPEQSLYDFALSVKELLGSNGIPRSGL